jgi:hypothetical protein
MDKQKLVSVLQAKIKRQTIQPVFNKYLKTARQNYDEATLKSMSSQYRADELKAALTDSIRALLIYNKPINKLKKHEIYHELLNVNYDFSNLQKKEAKRKVSSNKELNALKKEANKLTTKAANLEEKARKIIKGKSNDKAIKKYEDAKKLADEANKKVIDKMNELK